MDVLQIPITLALIGLNVLLSLKAFQDDAFMNRNLFIVGPILKRGEYYRLISSGFLHLNFMHLFVNMYVLFIMGEVLEPALGPVRFISLYGLSLIGGSLWSLMENRRNGAYSALGASGATSGLLLAFCFLAPDTWFLLPPVPAWVLAIGSFVITAILARRPNTRIGHDAHMGGMIFGGGFMLLLYPFLMSRFVRAIETAIPFL